MKEELKLNELDKLEFWDICRIFKPETTWEDYLAMWDEFQELKAEREMKKRLM